MKNILFIICLAFLFACTNKQSGEVVQLDFEEYKTEGRDGGAGVKTYVSIAAHNPSVGDNTTEDVCGSGTINFPSTAAALRIKAGGNAADTIAGAGARTVFVTGLDANWEPVTDTLTANGSAISTDSTITFIRVFSAYVGDVGTYGAANTGNIVIEDIAGAADVITILAGEGKTTSSLYTIPDRYTGYLTDGVSLSPYNKVTYKLWTRKSADDATAPMPSKQLVGAFSANASGVWADRLIVLDEREDIWLTGSVASGDGDSGASANYQILLIEKYKSDND